MQYTKKARQLVVKAVSFLYAKCHFQSMRATLSAALNAAQKSLKNNISMDQKML